MAGDRSSGAYLGGVGIGGDIASNNTHLQCKTLLLSGMGWEACLVSYLIAKGHNHRASDGEESSPINGNV